MQTTKPCSSHLAIQLAHVLATHAHPRVQNNWVNAGVSYTFRSRGALRVLLCVHTILCIFSIFYMIVQCKGGGQGGCLYLADTVHFWMSTGIYRACQLARSAPQLNRRIFLGVHAYMHPYMPLHSCL